MSSEEREDQAGSISWAKKLMTAGVGAFFLTEEALKTLVSEFKLPKEIVGSILDGAKNVRREFMQSVVSEMMTKVQDKIDPTVMVAEFFRKNDVTLEVKIKVNEKNPSDSDSRGV
ncbi:MAG: hypothetical protein KGP28_11865 [Bdellovibrionales bacterium]|nr:hypothetical protein [Bdellovibrionales bacterium]